MRTIIELITTKFITLIIAYNFELILLSANIFNT